MIYELRTYRLKTGAVPTYLRLVEEEGIAIQKVHLGRLVGYFFSEPVRSTRSSTSGPMPTEAIATAGVRLPPPTRAGRAFRLRSTP
jgi:hypothetical protein